MKKLISFALALSIIALPQAAQAAEKPVTVTPGTVFPAVAPCTGISPTEFTVSGKGFKPAEKIALTIGGVEYDDFAADAEGKYSETAEIRSLPSATYPVLLRGEQGTYAVSMIYIGFSACRSWSRDDVAIMGAGFAAEDDVTVTMDNAVAATGKTDPQGRFEVAFDCPKGKHMVKVTGKGNRNLSFAEFRC